MSKADLTRRATWGAYLKDIFRLIDAALALLQREHQMGMNEDAINRCLYFCFKRAAHALHLPHHLPIYEGRNPPHADDQRRAAREDKRPDFQWQLVDDTIADPYRSDRRFVLECKRLGTSPSASWVFNVNYIANGVVRFISVEHGYGKGDAAGGMVGYVESMDFADILSEVNTAASAAGVSGISAPAAAWCVGGLTQLDQAVTRSFAHTNYRIHHFWIDVR